MLRTAERVVFAHLLKEISQAYESIASATRAHTAKLTKQNIPGKWTARYAFLPILFSSPHSTDNYFAEFGVFHSSECMHAYR